MLQLFPDFRKTLSNILDSFPQGNLLFFSTRGFLPFFLLLVGASSRHPHPSCLLQDPLLTSIGSYCSTPPKIQDVPDFLLSLARVHTQGSVPRLEKVGMTQDPGSLDTPPWTVLRSQVGNNFGGIISVGREFLGP